DSPSGETFARQPYRVKPSPPPTRTNVKLIFPLCGLDTAAKPARLRAYTTFTTSCTSCASDWPVLRRLREELRAEAVHIIAVPTDEADDNPKLATFAQQWQPNWRLINIPPTQRAAVLALYTQVIGQPATLPSTVITDESGHLLVAHTGVPSMSEI